MSTATVLGLLGLVLPGALLDAPTFLAWLAVVALPAGCMLRGLRAGPWTFAVPAVWALAMIWLHLDVERTVPRPLGGSTVVAGLFLAGLGLGAVVRDFVPAAVMLLVLAAAPLNGGLGTPGSAARATPRLARLALELSPIGWTLECAGWDWSHADRDLYARSGVEFAPRHPHRVLGTGVWILLGGAALAAVGIRLRREDVT
ncbi:MAG: hypothetical protein WD226_14550 [Planctomycetota bacterium]